MELVEIGPGMKVPTNDYDNMKNRADSVSKEGKHGILARNLMRYFFGNESNLFWRNSTTNAETKAKLALARDSIHKCVMKETGRSTKRLLEDYCCQKRKYLKQINERASGLHKCLKCLRCCKSSSDRIKHERKCTMRVLQKPEKRRSRTAQKIGAKRKIVEVEKKIRNCYQKGLEVRYIHGKSRGIFARRKFNAGDFVCVYPGNLISACEGKLLEKTYEAKELGNYMFYFKFGEKNYCLDATEESQHFGRIINHSRKSPNVVPRMIDVDGIPRVMFVALHKIQREEELLYDYGETRKEAKMQFKWLNK